MAQLRANGAQALTLGLAGTPGYLAGSVLVVGAIDKADFLRTRPKIRLSDFSQL